VIAALIVWGGLAFLGFAFCISFFCIEMKEVNKQGYATKENRKELREDLTFAAISLVWPIALAGWAVYGLGWLVFQFGKGTKLAFGRAPEVEAINE
jgi:hypothetical protein